jgi:tartrate dehydratase beta subunit/fumarate hydratase class I family protein
MAAGAGDYQSLRVGSDVRLLALSVTTIHVARDQSHRRMFFSNEQADPIYLEGHTIRLCSGIEVCRVGQFG